MSEIKYQVNVLCNSLQIHISFVVIGAHLLLLSKKVQWYYHNVISILKYLFRNEINGKKQKCNVEFV